jgi:hypothetical protein
MFRLRIHFYLGKKTLHSSYTELVPEGAVSLEASVAGDYVLHLGQEPAVNLPNALCKYCRKENATIVDKKLKYLPDPICEVSYIKVK